jgi:2'-5' RNA ligase
METALVVAVKGLPPEISALRRRLDPSAEAGVPDHITVLYPFVPADHITNDVINRVAAAVAQVPACDFNLAEVRWFGEEVMWLAPDPDDPFRRLTLLVQAPFGTAPYGGVYNDVTPHLTIAHQADPEQMSQPRWPQPRICRSGPEPMRCAYFSR